MNNKSLGYSLLIFTVFGVSPLFGEPPADVLEKLHLPAPGINPLVLFIQSSETNEGSRSSEWIASSGSRLTARGRDPWGDDNGAFGPASAATAGAALASSANSPLLTGDKGALVVCFQVAQIPENSAMILSRGAWGDSSLFDLRAEKGQGVVLYSGAKDPKPQTLQLGRYIPGAWMFLGLTWKKQADGIVLETVLGQLTKDEAPQSNSFVITQAGELSAPVLLAGRTNPDLNPALLEGGLLCCVAIYEEELSPESLESLFQLMAAAAKP